MKFSDRFGYSIPKTIIQNDNIDNDLKNQLWNAVYMFYFSEFNSKWINSRENNNDRDKARIILLNRLYLYYFKNTLDQRPIAINTLVIDFKNYFFNTQWFNIYNFLEFIVDNCSNKRINKQFIEDCNVILKEELSGFRFVDGKITPITSEEEIKSIEDAILNSNQFKPVQEHLHTAIELFSNKSNPDYRNSIKESISAIESLVTILTNEPKLTLGQSLKKLEENGIYINKVFRSGLSTMYGYTSEEDGIRHGLLEESNLKQEDARFMLVICSSFTNYLIEKYNNL